MTDIEIEEKTEKLCGSIISIIGDHPFAGEVADFVALRCEADGTIRMEAKNGRATYLLKNTQVKIIV